ncbi:MAG: glutathione S-transferase [SAR86 cluster bacterium]|uniref:Glutathione S-transferase n=1 Tax=SAR86 cluster bacterium TaxID=2030880 RepID=A0A2A4X3R1_9GAMM|nr:MAG: glutathione S-transferase [SAR86 cluster bacterium]
MITFYTNPQSRGQIVHWLLEELGVPYDTVWIEYGEQMKSAEYLAVNPMGKVPAIKHKNALVTEAAAICTFLAVSYPEQGLAPAVGDPKLADFYRWMHFASGPLEMATTAKSIGWGVADEQRRMVGFGSYEETLSVIEQVLAEGPFICGDKFTAVDVYLGAALNWGMLFGTVEKRPAFEEYASRLQQRLAAQRAVQINEDTMQSAAS